MPHNFIPFAPGLEAFLQRKRRYNLCHIEDMSFNRFNRTDVVECLEGNLSTEKTDKYLFYVKRTQARQEASRRLVSLATWLSPRTSGALNIAIYSHGSLATCLPHWDGIIRKT